MTSFEGVIGPEDGRPYYDARLEHWFYSTPYGVLYGDIYGDNKGRCADGTGFRTSLVRDRTVKLEEGMIVSTRNSQYLLGKSADVVNIQE